MVRAGEYLHHLSFRATIGYRQSMVLFLHQHIGTLATQGEEVYFFRACKVQVIREVFDLILALAYLKLRNEKQPVLHLVCFSARQ